MYSEDPNSGHLVNKSIGLAVFTIAGKKSVNQIAFGQQTGPFS